MSFGERLVLEGLLSQLKPTVAIEIGTHQGGSLRLLAAHSGHVHAFDLYDLVSDKETLTTVTFHFGDSKVLVPTTLAVLAASRTPVDFALVDGDHSAEGVRADFENLLASPACRRTVILAHDTMNEDVRTGIEAIGLAERPQVVYVELDFVPGYKFATGSFAGRYFGGLGLVITGDRDTDGYGDQPMQSRYLPAFSLMHERD
jgi:cephalosporin hydroxylase